MVSVSKLKLRRKIVRAAITRTINRIKRGWTKDVPARTSSGVPCLPRCTKAVKWCAVGAVSASCVDFDTASLIRRTADKIVSSRSRVCSLVDFNDHVATKRSDVISIFEQAYNLVGDDKYLRDLVRTM